MGSAVKIGVRNSTDRPRTIAVEPMGVEFVIGPGSALEIVAECEVECPWVETVEWDDTTQVYLNNCGDFSVFQAGGCIFPDVSPPEK